MALMAPMDPTGTGMAMDMGTGMETGTALPLDVEPREAAESKDSGFCALDRMDATARKV